MYPTGKYKLATTKHSAKEHMLDTWDLVTYKYIKALKIYDVHDAIEILTQE